MPNLGVFGMPGIGSAVTAYWRRILRSGEYQWLGAGGHIDGTKTRDVGNTGYLQHLRAGLMMGKVTATGLYANSIIGLSQGAITASGTTLTTNAAIATELVRRIGATGTFKITGPPTAAGTVRTATATYSAVNTTTGDVTVTALGINEVQTIAFGAAATGGTVKIGFTLASGALVWTDTAAWSATDATFLSNINTAIDNLLGAGLVVATAIAATDTDLGFVLTFSGAGYTALPQTLVAIDASALTSVSTVTVTRTTTGQAGAFVTNSLIQPTDGSETILTFLPDGFPLQIVDVYGTAVNSEFAKIPVGGEITGAQLLDWPADASLRTYVRQSLSTLVGGKWVFGELLA